MTGKPTEKMVWRLKKLGFTQEDIDAMSYESASNIIGKALGTDKPANSQAKIVTTPQTEFVEQKGFKKWEKPVYNPASQFISYSKDIFLALREMVHVEMVKAPKMEIISDEVIMNRACAIVDIAVKHFNQ